MSAAPYAPNDSSASPTSVDLSERPSKGGLWTGRVLAGLLAVFLLTGGVSAWIGSAQVVQGTAKFGFPAGFLPILGTVELVCALLYLIPRTAALGAILLTAYMGGAVATHARIADPLWIIPVIFGVLVWVALLLRQPRFRRLFLTR